MQYRIIEDIREVDRARWNGFVEGHPSGSVFQSPDFADLFRGDDHYMPVFIGVLDENGKYLALVLAIIMNEYSGLRKLFASRTVVYGGPLVAEGIDDPEVVLGVLLDALVKKVKASIFIEFRNFYDISHFKNVFARHRFRYREHLNQIVYTNDINEVQRGMSVSKLRQVKNSLAAGAEIKEADSIEEIEEFYTLLKDLYKEKIRKPLPSIEFFRRFFEESKNGRLGKILVVKYKGHVVAGMVCPITTTKAIHEWYIYLAPFVQLRIALRSLPSPGFRSRPSTRAIGDLSRRAGRAG